MIHIFYKKKCIYERDGEEKKVKKKKFEIFSLMFMACYY